MENQGIVKVKFPRETDTKSGWTIDFSFLLRVRHSMLPDEDEWIPSPEEVERVLLSLEMIPAGIFTQPLQQEPVAWTVHRFFDDGTEHPCSLLEWAGENAENDFPVGTKFYTSPQPIKQEPVAWMHWLHNPVRVFLNKDEAMLELYRLNREYPADSDSRQMKPLYTSPQPIKQDSLDFITWYENAIWGNEDFKESCWRAWEAAIEHTSPQPSKPLTVEKIEEIINNGCVAELHQGHCFVLPYSFTRAIEQAHGIGNVSEGS
jgi:hypothetical protein